MIRILYDIETGTVRLASPAIIKVGRSVRVKVTFSAAPGTVTALTLTLGTDAAPPVALAVADDFDAESTTVYTALLDASATALVTHMADKSAAVLKAELASTIGGVSTAAPNFDVTVQQQIVAP